jgi:hypothetical protein
MDDEGYYPNKLQLITPDKVPIENTLSVLRTKSLLQEVLPKIREAIQSPTLLQAIADLKAIVEWDFSLEDEPVERERAAVKSLDLHTVEDYDEFFRIQRIVSPSPMESWIRSFLISAIVNWDNPDARLDATLKAGFMANVDLVERILGEEVA